MHTKPQIVEYLNPKLPRDTRVNLPDGREGTIVCRADQRHQRLVAFEGLDRPTLIHVAQFVRGRMPDGKEFRATFNGKTLVELKG